jgi:hypothetical protein
MKRTSRKERVHIAPEPQTSLLSTEKLPLSSFGFLVTYLQYSTWSPLQATDGFTLTVSIHIPGLQFPCGQAALSLSNLFLFFSSLCPRFIMSFL